MRKVILTLTAICSLALAACSSGFPDEGSVDTTLPNGTKAVDQTTMAADNLNAAADNLEAMADNMTAVEGGLGSSDAPSYDGMGMTTPSLSMNDYDAGFTSDDGQAGTDAAANLDGI